MDVTLDFLAVSSRKCGAEEGIPSSARSTRPEQALGWGDGGSWKSPLEMAFQAVWEEICVINDVLRAHRASLSGCILAQPPEGFRPIWFTPAECAQLDAEVRAKVTHVCKSVDAILAQVDRAERETAGAVGASQELAYFRGIGRSLYTVARDILDELREIGLRRTADSGRGGRAGIRSKRVAVQRPGAAEDGELTGQSDGISVEGTGLATVRLGGDWEAILNSPSRKAIPRPVEGSRGNGVQFHKMPELGFHSDSVLDPAVDPAVDPTPDRAAEPSPDRRCLQEVSLFDTALEEHQIVSETEQNALEIQRLGEMFAGKVCEQAEQISRLYAMALDADANLEAANTNLSSAKRSLRKSTKLTLFLLLLATFWILFIDYIHS